MALYLEDKADIVSNEQIIKHQPNFFAYRKMSSSTKELQIKQTEKLQEEKSKMRAKLFRKILFNQKWYDKTWTT